MLSAQVKELAEKLDQLSLEDKEWLLEQLMQSIPNPNILSLHQFHLSVDTNNVHDPLADFIGIVNQSNLVADYEQEL